MKVKGLCALMLLLLGAVFNMPSAAAQSNGVDEASLAAFSAELETIRQALKVPGWSAAIVSEQELVWAAGFGSANIEDGVAAAADTPYHLASVTKPIAATLLMQLVEDGLVQLDDPVSQYGVPRDNPEITVWHLLTHTSEGVPGSDHRYNGDLYSDLAWVMQAATGQSFARLLEERVLTPLGMTHTAPNPGWYPASAATLPVTLGLSSGYRHVPAVYRELARPYQFDADYENVAGSYSLHFSPGAGLLSTVVDVAKFDIALDEGLLVAPDTRGRMFTPARNNAGRALIYGLGWYTQRYDDERLIWHSGGWDPSVSALLLKVPDQNLTFILLANNYNLTRPYPLGDGDVLYSTPALAFYKHFVFPRHTGTLLPAIDWSADQGTLVQQLGAVTDPAGRDLLEHELWSYRKLYASTGRFDRADMLVSVHRRAFPDYRASLALPTAVSMNGPVTEPLPVTLRPDQVLGIGRFLLVWLALASISLVLLLIDFSRPGAVARPVRLAWLFATLLFGIVGLLAYRLSDCRYRRDCEGLMPAWARALGPTLYDVTGQVLALLLVLAVVVIYFPHLDGAALLALPVMFLVGWLLFRSPLAARAQQLSYGQAMRRTILPVLASTVPIIVGVVAFIVLVNDRLLRQIGPVNPFYWSTLPAAGLLAALLLYPLVFFQVRRGICDW